MLIDWLSIKNPVYRKWRWSVKDACMLYEDGTFYLFFSAFYRDRGRIRSHVVAVKTKDWKAFSEPIFIIDGRDGSWTGMCSPNISRIADRFLLTFNSWGGSHPNGRTNNLFYIISDDLESWSSPEPIAENLVDDYSVIDIALAENKGKYYVMLKEEEDLSGQRTKITKIAVGDALNADFQWIGNGKCTFRVQNGSESQRIHENYQFIVIDGNWHVLSTDYSPHRPWLYRMESSGLDVADEDWLTWIDGYELEVPQECFNPNHRSNAAFLADWRHHAGYFYLLYAGRRQGITHAGRGHNKLGLARSRDLKNWEVP